MTNLVIWATKSPLVCDVNGSKRKVFCILPPLQGQLFEASISCNSAIIFTSHIDIGRGRTLLNQENKKLKNIYQH